FRAYHIRMHGEMTSPSGFPTKVMLIVGNMLRKLIKDEQPDRITNVLPEHRAQAVIEAREAERQDAGSPDEV
nr:hypothetical protein [Candidatus Palauibacterales bacterium]